MSGHYRGWKGHMAWRARWRKHKAQRLTKRARAQQLRRMA